MIDRVDPVDRGNSITERPINRDSARELALSFVAPRGILNKIKIGQGFRDADAEVGRESDDRRNLERITGRELLVKRKAVAEVLICLIGPLIRRSAITHRHIVRIRRHHNRRFERHPSGIRRRQITALRCNRITTHPPVKTKNGAVPSGGDVVLQKEGITCVWITANGPLQDRIGDPRLDLIKRALERDRRIVRRKGRGAVVWIRDPLAVRVRVDITQRDTARNTGVRTNTCFGLHARINTACIRDPDRHMRIQRQSKGIVRIPECGPLVTCVRITRDPFLFREINTIGARVEPREFIGFDRVTRDQTDLRDDFRATHTNIPTESDLRTGRRISHTHGHRIIHAHRKTQVGVKRTCPLVDRVPHSRQ